jgi:hypothetical protein
MYLFIIYQYFKTGFITHQEAERKEKFKRNSLTATLFSIYKSKQLLPVNGYNKFKEIAENLKEDVTDNYANHIHKLNRKYEPGTAHKAARKIIGGLWKNDKLSIISGKEMIKRLSEWSQKDYGVSFNANAIAAELAVDEIDSEMQAVVTCIEQCVSFQHRFSQSFNRHSRIRK